MNHLKKKYGLPTAICMVVGVVIGSGVFFKAETVLTRTGGNMPLGILAWVIVGIIMIISSYVFATMANRYEKVNGLVDYAEATLGKRYAYNMGWFMAVIYVPCLVSVLAWVCARYTCTLLGWDITGGACMTIAAMYMCFSFALNSLSPKLAGKFQVSTTVIKMVPIALMAIVGSIYGLSNGTLVNEFVNTPSTDINALEALMGAVVSVAFACEGWILATSINAELENSKKNLPLALMIGSFIVVATYIFYYVGISGAVSPSVLLGSGENGVRIAFGTLFGSTAGTLVFVLIVISCLGTLNGLMLACCRGMYALAVRDSGPKAELFKQVDPYTNMPINSSIIGLAFSAFWLFYFYGANLGGGWFGNFCFDSSEMPIVTIYAMYIPMYIKFIMANKDLKVFARFVMPILAIFGACLMVYAAFKTYGASTIFHYLIVYAVIMIAGNILYKSKEKDAY